MIIESQVSKKMI